MGSHDHLVLKHEVMGGVDQASARLPADQGGRGEQNAGVKDRDALLATIKDLQKDARVKERDAKIKELEKDARIKELERDARIEELMREDELDRERREAEAEAARTARRQSQRAAQEAQLAAQRAAQESQWAAHVESQQEAQWTGEAERRRVEACKAVAEQKAYEAEMTEWASNKELQAVRRAMIKQGDAYGRVIHEVDLLKDKARAARNAQRESQWAAHVESQQAQRAREDQEELKRNASARIKHLIEGASVLERELERQEAGDWKAREVRRARVQQEGARVQQEEARILEELQAKQDEMIDAQHRAHSEELVAIAEVQSPTQRPELEDEATMKEPSSAGPAAVSSSLKEDVGQQEVALESGAPEPIDSLTEMPVVPCQLDPTAGPVVAVVQAAEGNHTFTTESRGTTEEPGMRDLVADPASGDAEVQVTMLESVEVEKDPGPEARPERRPQVHVEDVDPVGEGLCALTNIPAPADAHAEPDTGPSSGLAREGPQVVNGVAGGAEPGTPEVSGRATAASVYSNVSSIHSKGWQRPGHRPRCLNNSHLYRDQAGRLRVGPEERQRRSDTRSCFYCGRTGHYVNSCPQLAVTGPPARLPANQECVVPAQKATRPEDSRLYRDPAGRLHVTAEERERRVKTRSCFYCGQADHLRLSCPRLLPTSRGPGVQSPLRVVSLKRARPKSGRGPQQPSRRSRRRRSGSSTAQPLDSSSVGEGLPSTGQEMPLALPTGSSVATHSAEPLESPEIPLESAAFSETAATPLVPPSVKPKSGPATRRGGNTKDDWRIGGTWAGTPRAQPPASEKDALPSNIFKCIPNTLEGVAIKEVPRRQCRT